MLRDLCLALASVRSEARWTKQAGANQSVSLVLVVMPVFAGAGFCVCASFSGSLLRASEPIAVAVYLQYVDMMSQAVQTCPQSRSEPKTLAHSSKVDCWSPKWRHARSDGWQGQVTERHNPTPMGKDA